ncbi:hypothetical protein BCR44DRAFT_1425966 [Catenaria anguillulae PL171]|uniref:Uncharacterized protein n=1 Tax=Catenaria anguillulae PL171 TaxID=765915 RepID=A0A1Y2I3H7_9FUNG|nr:hypothetical protein BCR44DRAFT_1425966 [Catenaria anguillulae PL171]
MKSKQPVSHRQVHTSSSPAAASLLPLSPNELARITDLETKRARIARLSAVRLAERDMAKQRRLKFDTARRGKEEETIRLMSTCITARRNPQQRSGRQLVEVHHVGATDAQAPLGSAHRVAKEINTQRARQQVNHVHSQLRSDRVQTQRAKAAAVDELARRATPTIDVALRAAEMDAAKREANARSIAKARSHTPAPILIPVDSLTNLPSAVDLRGAHSSASLPTQSAQQPPGIPVVEYQSTRFHSTLLRDALPHGVDRSEPDLNMVSSSTHALNQSQQLEASTAAKQHLAQDQARRAAARGEAALARLRAKRVHDQVHAALEAARARDWDRRKVQFADYMTDRTPAKAPVPDQAKLENAFVNRFPEAARQMARELGEIWEDEHRSVSRALNRSHMSGSRSQSPSRSHSRSRSRSRSPSRQRPQSDPSHRYPPLQQPPSSAKPLAQSTPVSAPKRSSLKKPASSYQQGHHQTKPPLASASQTSNPPPFKEARPRSAPTPILPDPMAVLASTQPNLATTRPPQPINPQHLQPQSQSHPVPIQQPKSSPPATDELDSVLPMTSSASDSLFAGLSAPSTAPSASSFLRARGVIMRKSESHDSNESGTTWSTWGTATIDDMIDELGSWLSDAV